MVERERLMETAVYAGELMLMAGAETFRVEDTIKRMLEMYESGIVNVYVVTTGIFASVEEPGDQADVLVRRIDRRNNNLGIIAAVNDISRRFCAGEISVEEAWNDLKAAEKTENPRWLKNICYILTSVAFCALLGGGAMDCVIAGFNGIVLLLGMEINRFIKIKSFVMNMLITFAMSFLDMGLRAGVFTDMNLEVIIAGAIMALVPGLAITNAIRDTLNGDYISGTARAMEAFVVACAIGVGVGSGLALGSMVFKGAML